MAPQSARGRGRGVAAAAGGGRGAGRGDGAGGAAPGRKPPTGGASSAKSKKLYLQRKRQARAQARADNDSSSGGGDSDASGGERQPPRTQPRRAAPRGRVGVEGSDEASIGDEASGASSDTGDVSGSESDSGGSDGDAGRHAGERRGAAGARGPRDAAQRARAADAAAAREHAADARNAPPDADRMEAPLVYQPLVDVPPLEPAVEARAAGAEGAPAPSGARAGDARDGGGGARMVRLREEEVGQTEEGRSLGMPTRPAWQGVARTPEQLHALEERSFAAWRDALEARFGAGGAGRLSFYEGRLEFWRQLWRTLEMSDVVVIIVDARNPLLHFPEALYGHAGRDMGLPILLLLNKSDLVPPAASAAWRAWFEARHPGLRALPVSASPSAAADTRRAVLSALLETRVARRGGEARVGDVVGLGLDDLIAESLRRNTHAKRHALPGRAAPLQPAAAAAGGAAGGGAGSNSDEGGWTVKGTKAARKEAQRRKRRGQRRAPAARGRGGEGSDGDEEEGDGEEEEGDEDGEEEEEAALRLGMEGLTTEGLLRSLSAHDAAAAPGGPSAATPGGPSAASPPPNQRAGAGASDGAAGGPVVVGLVGEPNVGKSSTLNALLGSHRVAVSSHPGRTKHYQTHYVSRRLVLCDCPGLVFPRLDVSLPMQVLFGSFPIAHCRDPYAVVRYLAERIWPRLHDALGLKPPPPGDDGAGGGGGGGGSGGGAWTPLSLCEALAARHNWRSRRGGRPDVYRAANSLLRGALAGKPGLVLAFLPPAAAGDE